MKYYTLASPFILLALCFPAIALCQGGSLLQQLMASNPLISRPNAFREMQNEIATSLKDQSPGIRLNYISDEIASIRKRILAELDTCKISGKQDTLLIEYGRRPDSLRIPLETTSTPMDHLNALEDRIKSHLSSRFRKNLRLGRSDARTIIISLADNFFMSVPNLGDANKEKEPAERLAGLIASAMIAELSKNLQSLGIPLHTRIRVPELAAGLQLFTDGTLADLREVIGLAFGKVEYEVSVAVEEIHKWAIEGNIGAGISTVNNEEASVGGGVMGVFSVLPSFQLAAFVNGKVSGVEQGDGDFGLGGFRLRYAWDKHEIDVITSILPSENVWELGAGHTYASADLLFGPSLVISADVNEDDSLESFFDWDNGRKQLLIGASIAPKIPGAPSFFLGFRVAKGNSSPIAQINVPIIASK